MQIFLILYFSLGFWWFRIIVLNLHRNLKTKVMNKMNFHEFFEYLWEDEVIEIIVSTAYLEENDDFIRHYTLDLYRFYEMSNLPAKYFKKLVEITFTALFAFQPGTQNIKEIPDGYRNSSGDY